MCLELSKASGLVTPARAEELKALSGDAAAGFDVTDEGYGRIQIVARPLHYILIGVNQEYLKEYAENGYSSLPTFFLELKGGDNRRKLIIFGDRPKQIEEGRHNYGVEGFEYNNRLRVPSVRIACGSVSIKTNLNDPTLVLPGDNELLC